MAAAANGPIGYVSVGSGGPLPLDPAIVDLIKQLPISVALIIVLIYLIRTNRQDRHELNLVAETQADTEKISAENQKRLIERSETLEATLSGMTARITEHTALLQSLSDLNKTLIARIEQSAAATDRIRSREEAKLDQQVTIDKLSAVIKEQTSSVLDNQKIALGEKDLTLRKLDTIHTAVTAHGADLQKVGAAIDAIPPQLSALNVKMDGLPPIIVQAYRALEVERDKAVAEVCSLTEQLKALADENARLKVVSAPPAASNAVQAPAMASASLSALPTLPTPITPPLTSESLPSPERLAW